MAKGKQAVMFLTKEAVRLGPLADAVESACEQLVARLYLRWTSPTVGELARDMPVSRPAVSQHLKVRKNAGLVIDRAAGTDRIYQLDPAGVGALRAYLDRFWSRALAAYMEAVEQPREEIS